MTVEKLIKILQTYHPTLEVVIPYYTPYGQGFDTPQPKEVEGVLCL